MARARIYDAAFAAGTNGTHHAHLGTVWWIDTAAKKGSWTRLEAYNYVLNNPGDIYVSEDTYSVGVRAYHNSDGVKWIQTEADGVKRDNLLTLARRHAQGLANN
jgi:hypothetical protein